MTTSMRQSDRRSGLSATLCSRVTIDARSALSSVILVITLRITLLAKSHKPLSRNARFAEPQRNRIADCHRDACMGVADNGEDPLIENYWLEEYTASSLNQGPFLSPQCSTAPL